MLLKILNPITNGSRHQKIILKSLLSKNNNLIKQPKKGIKNVVGRSSQPGRITTRHKGGGCKKKFSFINFLNINSLGLVISILYDAKRSAFISLNYNLLTKIFYNTIATNGVFPGSIILCNKEVNELKLGSRTLLLNVPTGSIINGLTSFRTSNSCFIRSAGTYGQIFQKMGNFCKIKLPSGCIIEKSIDSYATMGVVSNTQHNLICIGKAGKNRLRGKRPSVRGIAMNPVDHPHGGRTNGGMLPVTPWGKPTRGKATVKKKIISYE